MRKICVVAAGGTGGHLFPAQALAEALIARGWRIVLATDERGAAYAAGLPGRASASACRPPPSGPATRSAWPRAGVAIVRGRAAGARAPSSASTPDVVVGFGGYPSLPALLAALGQRRPTVIHEQNAVLGRANRMLAPLGQRRRLRLPDPGEGPAEVKAARAVVVGNPVRPDIRALSDRALRRRPSRRPDPPAGHRRQPGRAPALRDCARRPSPALPERPAPRLKVAAADPRRRPWTPPAPIYRRRHGRGRGRALLPRHGRPAAAPPIW